MTAIDRHTWYGYKNIKKIGRNNSYILQRNYSANHYDCKSETYKIIIRKTKLFCEKQKKIFLFVYRFLIYAIYLKIFYHRESCF